jgi:hypothetical protein
MYSRAAVASQRRQVNMPLSHFPFNSPEDVFWCCCCVPEEVGQHDFVPLSLSLTYQKMYFGADAASLRRQVRYVRATVPLTHQKMYSGAAVASLRRQVR